MKQDAEHQCFSKAPKNLYQLWHSRICGYLPIDKELFNGSLLGARDREYGVCRLKPKMLENSRRSREPPKTFVPDEQINPYHGMLSGAKKRAAKKTGVGLQFYTLATSNKGYAGFQEAVYEENEEHNRKSVLQKQDPVCGGFKLNYTMSGGRRYEVGYSHNKKVVGVMMSLIFGCSDYLRYNNCIAVTDSAYGFLPSMCLMSLWGISWVTSFSISQRRGFLGIPIFMKAGKKAKADRIKKQKPVGQRKEVSKRSIKEDVGAWMKANKDVKKGTSMYWITSIEAMHGFFVNIWLTAVRDSKWVWRLDNFLGPRYKSKMFFWDYSDDDFKSDVKKKTWLGAEVAESHHMYRFFMGAVDQSDVKSRVMNLTRELVSYWPQKMLYFLIEASVINSYANYNLDQSTSTEGFTD